ncbi:hypothetical protein VCSRO90_2898 [Vibrio cholerae]|nr:hypothetical protein VCSRO90_2898 [Vibrio cholerae]
MLTLSDVLKQEIKCDNCNCDLNNSEKGQLFTEKLKPYQATVCNQHFLRCNSEAFPPSRDGLAFSGD